MTSAFIHALIISLRQKVKGKGRYLRREFEEPIRSVDGGVAVGWITGGHKSHENRASNTVERGETLTGRASRPQHRRADKAGARDATRKEAGSHANTPLQGFLGQIIQRCLHHFLHITEPILHISNGGNGGSERDLTVLVCVRGWASG